MWEAREDASPSVSPCVWPSLASLPLQSRALLCFRTQVLSSHPLPWGAGEQRARVMVTFCVYWTVQDVLIKSFYIYRVYNLGLCGWSVASRCKGVGRNSLGRTCLTVIIAKSFTIIIFCLFFLKVRLFFDFHRMPPICSTGYSDLIFKKLSL